MLQSGISYLAKLSSHFLELRGTFSGFPGKPNPENQRPDTPVKAHGCPHKSR
jgi:hypothetical protein